MAIPLPPGVYFERADAPSRAIDEVRSDIAGFVGVAERGPLHKPVRVQSWTQFQTRFGVQRSDDAYLSSAVRGFFANGGRTAWIVRVGRPASVTSYVHASLYLVNGRGQPLFRVCAKDPGVGGGSISVRVLRAPQNRFHLVVDVPSEEGLGLRETLETWRDLEVTKDASSPHHRYAPKVVNGWPSDDRPDNAHTHKTTSSGSHLIEIVDLGIQYPTSDAKVVGVRTSLDDSASEGAVGLPAPIGYLSWPSDTTLMSQSVFDGLTREHFTGDGVQPWGLAALESIEEVSIVACPDLMWYSVPTESYAPPRCRCEPRELPEPPTLPQETRPGLSQTDQEYAHLQLLAHCARTKNRFAILDAPPLLDPDQIERWAERVQSHYGQYGALYYPWIGVSTAAPGVTWIPPSGHLAGLFARVDLSRGVHKSPANELLVEVQAVGHDVDNESHGRLNTRGINVLKAAGIRGVRVMGARTLVDPRDPESKQWQFVSVRRLLLMIERSLEQSTYWLVHSPNRPDRWRDVEGVVRSFLMRQWRMGRLGGTTPDEAFSVECNDATNPYEEVEQGRLTCLIGVQPPLPAEFVFVRLGDRSGDIGNWSLGGSGE